MSDTPDKKDDQLERADEEAARAAAADEAEAAPDAGAADPEVADEAVEAAVEAPGAEAADEPVAEEKPKRSHAKKAEPEPPAAAPARKRDRRRPVETGVQVSAHAKYVRTSARKARLVCEHIRGKDVEQARAILAFTPRAAAKDWAKLLESAVANAEHNHELVGEELRIAAVYADEGPTLKRYRPRAMGRATRIRKRTSHLTITLTPKEL
jgi:ribosomal protein L22